MNATELIDRLHVRYAAPEWASFEEVRDATGTLQRRTVDFYAVNCYPSRYNTVAVEVKVSRADFMRELERPEKRAGFEAMANEFWFCTPAGLVKDDEVPEGCGLLVTRGNGLVRKKAAKQRKCDPDKWLWVSLVRRAAEEAARAKELAERDDAIASLGGRPLTMDDVRRIVEHYHGERHSWQVQQAVNHASHDALAKRRGAAVTWQNRWRLVHEEIVKVAEDQRWCRNPDPESVLEALARLKAMSPAGLAGLSEKLREAADRLDEALTSGPPSCDDGSKGGTVR